MMNKILKKLTPVIVILLALSLAIGAGLYSKLIPEDSIPKLDPNNIISSPLLVIESWPSELPYLREAALLDSGPGFWLATTPLTVSQATEFFLQDLKEYGWSVETAQDGRNANIVGVGPTGEVVGVDITKKSYKQGPENWCYIKIVFIDPESSESAELLKQT